MEELSKLLLLLLLSLSSLLPHSTAEIPRLELDSATAALRSRGYNLFGNSLTVSDLLFQILSGDEFTLLSPPDTSLFSLGMSIDSFRYVHSLRLHLLPRRLSLHDLRNLSLSPSPFSPSLIPTSSLSLSLSTPTSSLLVNGIRISSPDIFIGPHIAVHGLDGTLAADLLPPDALQTDLAFSFVPPPSTEPIPPPLDESFSPIFPFPDLPPPIPRVPSPAIGSFPDSPEIAEIPSPVSGPPVYLPPPIVSGPPVYFPPSTVSGPPVYLPPPIVPPRIWGAAPPLPPPYRTVWRNDGKQEWGKPKESHDESGKHRKASKKKRKGKNRHHHQYRKHKGL